MKKRTVVSTVIVLILLLALACACLWLFMKWTGYEGKFSFIKGRETEVESKEETEVQTYGPMNNFSINELSPEIFALSEKSKKNIVDYVNNWISEPGKYESNAPFFNELQLYCDRYPYASTEISEPVIFIFSPEFQGICTIGFCDSLCNWKNEKGIIGIFDEKGILLSASFDSILTRQNFDIQLSADEVYYLVLCKMYDNDDETDVSFRICQNIKNGR